MFDSASQPDKTDMFRMAFFYVDFAVVISLVHKETGMHGVQRHSSTRCQKWFAFQMD